MALDERLREILTDFKSAPISTLTTEGRIYSIDSTILSIKQAVQTELLERLPKKDTIETMPMGILTLQDKVDYRNQVISEVEQVIKGVK